MIKKSGPLIRPIGPMTDLRKSAMGKAKRRKGPIKKIREKGTCILITTYNRPEKLNVLLEQIAAINKNADVLVYDDCSTEDYSLPVTTIRHLGWKYIRFDHNHGKAKFWQIINRIMSDLKKRKPYKYYFILQDDVSLCRDFFNKSIQLWESIGDKNKISLLLLRDSRGSDGRSIWTNQKIISYKNVSRVQFLDFPAFVCNRNWFDSLSWRIMPIPSTRWLTRPTLSSGVGEQVSHRLHKANLSMYRSNKSYVTHSHSISLLNPSERDAIPLSAIFYIDDGVTVSIASIPSRKESLKKVIRSLMPQADHINVYLNGYKRIPNFLKHDKITVAMSSKHGDRGDAGKFFWANSVNGIHFHCDDDILYSSNYISTMVAKLRQYGLRAVVGCHACTLSEPIQSYYGSRKIIHFKAALSRDVSVNVLGTGTIAYHTQTISVKPEDFKTKNMADVWFAVLGQKQKVPFLSIQRPANWLVPTDGTSDDSIYRSSKHNKKDGKNTGDNQTRVVKKLAPWKVHNP